MTLPYYGFKPYDSTTSTTYNAQTVPYQIANNVTPALFNGDPVSFSGGYLAKCTTPPTDLTNPMLGVFKGCNYIDKNNKPVYTNYWPGGDLSFTGTYIWADIYVDKNIRFAVSVGSAVTPTITAVGQGCTFAYGTGSTTLQQSGAYLDTTNATNTAAYWQFKIVGLPGTVSSAINSTGFGNAGIDVLVQMNNTFISAGQRSS